MSKKGTLWFGTRFTLAVRDHAPEEWSKGLRTVLFVLATYMDNTTGKAVVGHETLGRGCGLSRGTVCRLLNTGFTQNGLGGWLKREKLATVQGQYPTWHYQGVIPHHARQSVSSQLSGQEAQWSNDWNKLVRSLQEPDPYAIQHKPIEYEPDEDERQRGIELIRQTKEALLRTSS